MLTPEQVQFYCEQNKNIKRQLRYNSLIENDIHKQATNLTEIRDAINEAIILQISLKEKYGVEPVLHDIFLSATEEYITIQFAVRLPETNEEFAERMYNHDMVAKAAEERERKEYERLRLKFEGK